jgi:hypothetical protein
MIFVIRTYSVHIGSAIHVKAMAHIEQSDEAGINLIKSFALKEG